MEAKMTWKRGDDGAGSRVYVFVAAPDDASAALGRLADEVALSSAQLTTARAFSRATVGSSDRQAKDFRRIEARPV
jgi:hypothetical protein